MSGRKKVQPGWPGEFLEGPHLSPQGERDVIDCCLAGEGAMPEALQRETIDAVNEILESMVLRDDDARVLWANLPTHAEMHETLRSVAHYSKMLLDAIARLDMMTAVAITDHGFTSQAWRVVEMIFGFDPDDGVVVTPQKHRDAKALMLAVAMVRQLFEATEAAHEQERSAAARGEPRERKWSAAAFVVGASASVFTCAQVELRKQRPELAFAHGSELETEARLAFITRVLEEGGVLVDIPGNPKRWIEDRFEEWCRDSDEVSRRALADTKWLRRRMPLVAAIRGFRIVLGKDPP